MEDGFTKGMSHWDESDDEATPNYAAWQLGPIRPFLGRRVLEIGAGAGRFISLLNAPGKVFERYAAVEPSGHFFKMLQSRFPGMEIYNKTADGLDASFNGAFDTVFSVHVLEHVEDDLKLLKEADRLLAPRGRIIITVPALGCLMSELDRNVGHYRRYDKAMIKKLAGELGYKVIFNRYANLLGAFGWFFVCKLGGMHYQQGGKKKKLMFALKVFDRFLLPAVSLAEKLVPMPFGLSLTAVIEKPAR